MLMVFLTKLKANTSSLALAFFNKSIRILISDLFFAHNKTANPRGMQIAEQLNLYTLLN